MDKGGGSVSSVLLVRFFYSIIVGFHKIETGICARKKRKPKIKRPKKNASVLSCFSFTEEVVVHLSIAHYPMLSPRHSSPEPRHGAHACLHDTQPTKARLSFLLYFHSSPLQFFTCTLFKLLNGIFSSKNYFKNHLILFLKKK